LGKEPKEVEKIKHENIKINFYSGVSGLISIEKKTEKLKQKQKLKQKTTSMKNLFENSLLKNFSLEADFSVDLKKEKTALHKASLDYKPNKANKAHLDYYFSSSDDEEEDEFSNMWQLSLLSQNSKKKDTNTGSISQVKSNSTQEDDDEDISKKRNRKNSSILSKLEENYLRKTSTKK